MSKRFDNKRIIYILAGLLVILAITFLVRIPSQKATIREKLIDLDTSSVAKIIFYPKTASGEPFEFTRTNGRWYISQKNITAAPERNVIQNIFLDVMNIKPKSLEAVDQSKWKEYDLTDSLAIRVKFLNGKGKVLADLMIGRFTYEAPGNQYGNSNPYNIQGTSYVRLHNEKQVFAVDGFLSLSFSGKFNDYRDRTFLSFNSRDVTNIKFIFPADSSFTLSKKDSVWYADQSHADSSAVSDYLSTLSYIDGQNINDNFKPAASPLCELQIEGNNLLSINVKCYEENNGNEYQLVSGQNPDVCFSSRKDDLFAKIFKPEKHFLTGTSAKTAGRHK